MNDALKTHTPEEEPNFYHRLPVQIRFNDVDRYGHVNNNAYFAYYDLGKQEYLYKVLKADYRSEETVPVIANINADFFIPIITATTLWWKRACRTSAKKVLRFTNAPSISVPTLWYASAAPLWYVLTSKPRSLCLCPRITVRPSRSLSNAHFNAMPLNAMPRRLF